MKRTKMICTIGPASDSLITLSKLIESGMNIARLNFSHGNHEEHAQRIANIRNASKNANPPIAIMLDTKGPEIRTMGLKKGKPVQLTVGDTFVITTDTNVIGDEHRVAVTYQNITDDLKMGNRILIDDGLIELVVEKIEHNELHCKVLNSAELGEFKGVNLPNVLVNLPILSEKDKQDLIFGCHQHVDFIAASFIRKRTDIEVIRQFLDSHNGQHIAIIAKIENQEGLDNFDDILTVADGIMVARGDLGVEIPIEDVILAQKRIIEKCNRSAKPVITATQMLESMTINPRPTRAEAGDVANAVLDGTDAVMLSGETAKGLYPVETVKMMNQICQRAEQCSPIILSNGNESSIDVNRDHFNSVIIENTLMTSSLIVVMSEYGEEAKLIRRYFPNITILAITPNDWVLKQLLLVKSVYPHLINKKLDRDLFVQYSKKLASETKLAKCGETITIVTNYLNENNNFFITSTTI